jgi:hypothetical protein
MTPQEKAMKAAELLTAWAKGKTLQQLDGGKWHDLPDSQTPDFGSAYIAQWQLSDWRIKPGLRKKWGMIDDLGKPRRTNLQKIACKWKAAGYKVTEWVEVV